MDPEFVLVEPKSTICDSGCEGTFLLVQMVSERAGHKFRPVYELGNILLLNMVNLHLISIIILRVTKLGTLCTMCS